MLVILLALTELDMMKESIMATFSQHCPMSYCNKSLLFVYNDSDFLETFRVKSCVFNTRIIILRLYFTRNIKQAHPKATDTDTGHNISYIMSIIIMYMSIHHVTTQGILSHIYRHSSLDMRKYMY